MKPRDLIRMSHDELDFYLSQPNTATVCTFNQDRTIHAVAMFFAFDDGALVFHTKAKSQKARNLERDARLTVLVESGSDYHDLRGVELVGKGEIVRDPNQLHRIGLLVHQQRNGATPVDRDELRMRLINRVGIRLSVERAVSWDHTKLPG